MPTLQQENKNKVGFQFEPSTHTYTYDGKKMTGVTSIISTLAKPQLISWAARMAVEYIQNKRDGWKMEFISPIEAGDSPWSTFGKLWADFSENLDIWLEEAKSAHTKKKEAAGEHGTDTHALVERYVNTELMRRSATRSTPIPVPMPMAEMETIKPFIDWAVENVDHFLFSERQMYNKELWIAGTADFAYIGKDGKKYMADFKTSSGIYGIDYWLQCAAYRMLAEGEGDAPYDGCTVVRLGKDGSFEAQHRFDYETDKEAFLACLTLYRAQATYTKK